MLNVAKYGACGVAGGVLANSLVNPKTQKGEHAANNFSTAVSLGALAATPYAVKNIVKNNPRAVVKVANKAGVAIEKGAEYALKAKKYVKNLLEGEKASKIVTSLENAFSKVKNSKVGKKVVDAFNKVKSKPIVQKYTEKAAKALEKFAKSPTTKKGLIGLAAAGTALLAYAAFKTITNHYRKEGAIDQKYDDMHKKYERMIETFPITNAQTGEPISFEQFCKYSQTYVK